MTAPRILVAGIGNIFFGDDGFGVAVAAALAKRPLPAGVVLMDAGIRGIDLTYALMDGYDAAILIDVMRRGKRPGTLTVLDPAVDTPSVAGASLLDAHGLDPQKVLAFVRSEGARLDVLRIVGCEPEHLGSDDDEPVVGLSAAVERAVGPAAEIVVELLTELGATFTRVRVVERRHA